MSRRKGAGARRPDAQALTPGFCKIGCAAEGFTVWKCAGQGDARSINVPALLAWYKDDTCAYTRPADIPAFRPWLGVVAPG